MAAGGGANAAKRQISVDNLNIVFEIMRLKRAERSGKRGASIGRGGRVRGKGSANWRIASESGHKSSRIDGMHSNFLYLFLIRDGEV
jgi:hypothetical protein